MIESVAAPSLILTVVSTFGAYIVIEETVVGLLRATPDAVTLIPLEYIAFIFFMLCRPLRLASLDLDLYLV